MMKKIDNLELKYILGSLLLQEKCGQKCIRRAYEEFKKNKKITYDKEILHTFTDQLKKEEVSIIADWEADYPSYLRDLYDPPLLLFYRGNLEILKGKIICIVGTRKNSIYGARVLGLLFDAIKTLPDKANISTVSGLAYGIDRKVHQRSLQIGMPTIAVVAGGIDKGYPRINQTLYDRIWQDGLILSEFPPGVEIIKGMFPMRNRIMAALAAVTIVVEAPVDSGSLITARIAVELGRDVYTFPGDIFRECSKGGNQLISDGAMPLTGLMDIKALLNTF